MDARIRAVEFDEEAHRYFYKGRELFGVTGAIGKLMGKSFPDTDIVKLKAIYGSDVHKEVENYFNSGSRVLSSESARWVVEAVEKFSGTERQKVDCEVMVSDFEGTASKVDVVLHTETGVYLFDIKTTTHFDRAYCSLQLSVYKKLYEENYGEKVLGMYVLGTKARRLFRILEQEEGKVRKILNMNKGE